MRCFLAIELSEEVKEELLRVQEEIKPLILGKFVERENLHLTLKFFGELGKDEINKVKNELKKVNSEKFLAYPGRIGFFPNNKFINVIWVSLEPREKFRELNTKINEELNTKDEKFESHVTLARIKKVKDKLGLMKRVKELKLRSIAFDVKDFVLKKSTLTSDGPLYEDIERFGLS